MNYINIQYVETPIGELIMGAFDQKLCMLDFRYRKMRSSVDHRLQKGLNADFKEQENATLELSKQQLFEYLSTQRKKFDIPLLMVGTDFQKQVWNALLQVPYGETCSYLELARNINNEKAVRAVASANGANAIGVIIPCHRIIGSNGSLTGYAGGLAAKQRLLNLEQPQLF